MIIQYHWIASSWSWNKIEISSAVLNTFRDDWNVYILINLLFVLVEISSVINRWWKWFCSWFSCHWWHLFLLILFLKINRHRGYNSCIEFTNSFRGLSKHLHWEKITACSIILCNDNRFNRNRAGRFYTWWETVIDWKWHFWADWSPRLSRPPKAFYLRRSRTHAR